MEQNTSDFAAAMNSFDDTSYVCSLSPKDLQTAELELNEKEEERLFKVSKLREQLVQAGDIRCPMDAHFLLRFLRAKKFETDRAYVCLRRYYEARQKHRDIFHEFHPTMVRHVLDEKIVTVLPNIDAKGRRVMLIRPGHWHPETLPLPIFMRAILICLEWLLMEEAFQVNGLVLFVDCASLGMKQYRQFNRERIRLLMFLVQEAFPVRLKAIHIMNAPGLLQYLLTIVRFFLKEKVKQRIQVHGFRLYGLFNDLGEDAIPEQYGGRLILDPDWWRDQLVTHEADNYFRRHFGEGIVHDDENVPIVTIDAGEPTNSAQNAGSSLGLGTLG